MTALDAPEAADAAHPRPHQGAISNRSMEIIIGHLGLVNLVLVPVSSVVGGLIGARYGWLRPVLWMLGALLCAAVTVVAIGSASTNHRNARIAAYVATLLGAVVVGVAPAVAPAGQPNLIGAMVLLPMTWTAVFVAVSAPRRTLFLLAVVVAMGLSAVILFRSGDPALQQLAGAAAPYAVFLAVLHHVVHRTMVDNIALQLELERLTGQLSAERTHLATLNEQLEVTNALLEHSATHDSLSDTLNRRGLHEYLDRMLGGATLQPVDLLYLDLDGFKDVNDELGHQRGDATLVAVADILRACVGPDGVVGRYGGDEFVVIVRRSTRCTGHDIAERILAGLNSAPGVLPTASIGLASAPLHGITGSELVRCADAALHAAKKTGRNRLVEAPMDHPMEYGG